MVRITCVEAGSWIVTNEGAEPLTLVRAHLPHSQYRSEPLEITPPLVIPSGQSVPLSLDVVHDGNDVENPFLILNARSDEKNWLVLVRLRVKVTKGVPHEEVKAISTQQLG